MGITRVLRWSATALAWGIAQAETWRTVDGETWEGKLSGVVGERAVFSISSGSRQVALEQLDDAALRAVADHLARTSAAPWKSSSSTMATALRTRLETLDGDKLVAFDEGARAEPEIYLLYFGALWCGPCGPLSPKLVEAYTGLKRTAGDKLEMIFVSDDRDRAEQLEHVRKVRMPWTVLKFSAVGRVAPIERWAGRSIPCLVALNRDGEMVASSYRGVEDLGAAYVLKDVTAILAAMNGEPGKGKRGMHRLAVAQHLRRVGTGSCSPAVHLIDMDLGQYRTLGLKELTANLEIDTSGKVLSASFEPKVEAVLEYQLQQEALTWLFLPAVKDGKARAIRVSLPLKL